MLWPSTFDTTPSSSPASINRVAHAWLAELQADLNGTEWTAYGELEADVAAQLPNVGHVSDLMQHHEARIVELAPGVRYVRSPRRSW